MGKRHQLRMCRVELGQVILGTRQFLAYWLGTARILANQCGWPTTRLG